MEDVIPELGKWYFFSYEGRKLEGLVIDVSYETSIAIFRLRYGKGKEQAVSFGAIIGEA